MFINAIILASTVITAAALIGIAVALVTDKITSDTRTRMWNREFNAYCAKRDALFNALRDEDGFLDFAAYHKATDKLREEYEAAL